MQLEEVRTSCKDLSAEGSHGGGEMAGDFELQRNQEEAGRARGNLS